MKVIRALLVMDVLLILSGIGWILIGPEVSAKLVAFNRPVSPTAVGILILLVSAYQSMRLRQVYLRVRDAAKQ